MSVCDASATRCLTIATFAEDALAFAQERQYVSVLGRYALGTETDRTWTVYFFPYRYDEKVGRPDDNGDRKTVREWIYSLR